MAKDDQEPRDQTTDSYSGNQRESAMEALDKHGIQEGELDPTDPYVNVGTVGAGTIRPDGTYGPPMPDPLVVKAREEEEGGLDLHGQDPDQDPGIQTAKRTSATKSTTTAKKDPEPTK